MNEQQWLAERFEEQRERLRAVAYRMLGSLSEADDAVQEAWIKLSRSDAHQIGNLAGWLTTVVGRVCLDMLRARRSRREEHLGEHPPDVGAPREWTTDPETEAELADSVGLALLVVLETLAPAERLAFVLHDLFALPFDEIAQIVGRSEVATRQLASRARRRVHGARAVGDVDLGRQREVVEAFLAAAKSGDFEALVRVLDAEVVLHADATAATTGKSVEVRGARNVARGAIAASARAPFARPALVNGAVGIIVAPRGRLGIVLAFRISQDKIVAIDVIADRARLAEVDIGVLD